MRTLTIEYGPRPTEADIQSALTEATRVIDRAESIPF